MEFRIFGVFENWRDGKNSGGFYLCPFNLMGEFNIQ
jgi:hypothetical protein